jgi:hypothetical protein
MNKYLNIALNNEATKATKFKVEEVPLLSYLLLHKAQILTKGLFHFPGRDNGNGHQDNTCNPATCNVAIKKIAHEFE